MHLAVKAHFLRENDNMEEDEWREKVYRLKDLVEEYKQLSQNNDPDDNEDSPSDDDYWNQKIKKNVREWGHFKIINKLNSKVKLNLI